MAQSRVRAGSCPNSRHRQLNQSITAPLTAQLTAQLTDALLQLLFSRRSLIPPTPDGRSPGLRNPVLR